jgi:hypothetical protein
MKNKQKKEISAQLRKNISRKDIILKKSNTLFEI